MADDSQSLLTEFKWEGRLWTLFQIGLVALVGYLTLQTVESQRILAQMVIEHRYTNVRLEKIETQMERGIDDRYRGTDARRDFEIVNRSVANLEARMRSIELQDQTMASEIFDIKRRIGIQDKLRSDP